MFSKITQGGISTTKYDKVVQKREKIMLKYRINLKKTRNIFRITMKNIS